MLRAAFQPLQRLAHVVIFLAALCGFGWTFYCIYAGRIALLKAHSGQVMGCSLTLMGLGFLFEAVAQERGARQPLFQFPPKPPLPDDETLRRQFSEMCEQLARQERSPWADLLARPDFPAIMRPRLETEERLSLTQQAAIHLCGLYTPVYTEEPARKLTSLAVQAAALVGCGVALLLLPPRQALWVVIPIFAGYTLFFFIRSIYERIRERVRRDEVTRVDLAVALLLDDPDELVDALHQLGTSELWLLRFFDPHSATSDGARARRLSVALERSRRSKSSPPQRLGSQSG